MKHLFIYIFASFLFISCEKSTTEPIIAQNALLSNPTWQIQKSSAIGGGFNLDFDKNVNYDHFQLAKVRVKFEPTGAVSGIDNNGNVIKDGVWKLIEDEKKLEISGTGIFGIDGTLIIVTLQKDLLEFSNILKVTQLNAVVDMKATLIPVK
jgi:hypothetical protein